MLLSRLFSVIILGLLAWPLQVQAQPIIAEESEEASAQEVPVIDTKYTGLKIRAINKITTRSQEMETTIGAVTRFGNIEIIPRGCWVAPPNKRPEQAGLMEIWYWKQGEKPILVFFGWMFASSPALSSLEHPVYDITMLECIKDTTQQPAADTDSETSDISSTNDEAETTEDEDEGVRILED